MKPTTKTLKKPSLYNKFGINRGSLKTMKAGGKLKKLKDTTTTNYTQTFVDYFLNHSNDNELVSNFFEKLKDKNERKTYLKLYTKLVSKKINDERRHYYYLPSSKSLIDLLEQSNDNVDQFIALINRYMAVVALLESVLFNAMKKTDKANILINDKTNNNYITDDVINVGITTLMDSSNNYASIILETHNEIFEKIYKARINYKLFEKPDEIFKPSQTELKIKIPEDNPITQLASSITKKQGIIPSQATKKTDETPLLISKETAKDEFFKLFNIIGLFQGKKTSITKLIDTYLNIPNKQFVSSL